MESSALLFIYYKIRDLMFNNVNTFYSDEVEENVMSYD